MIADATRLNRQDAADILEEDDHPIWVELGFAADGTRLFHHEWAEEQVAAWRVFGWLLTDDYAIVYTDTNTMEMRRTDPSVFVKGWCWRESAHI